MGCACINVSSKLTIVKSNKILRKNNTVTTKNSKNDTTKMSVALRIKNRNRELSPIIWMNIVDYLSYKDLQESRKINR